MDMKKILKMLEKGYSHEEIKERILSGQDLKGDIKDYVVVLPNFKWNTPGTV